MESSPGQKKNCYKQSSPSSSSLVTLLFASTRFFGFGFYFKSAKMITALVKPYKLDARQHSGYRRSVSLLLENFSLGLVELLATLANSANNILNLLLSIYMLIE
jgi:hypothetical protein